MAKKGIFTRRPIITGYGRTTGYSHALKLNPAKVDPNFDSTPASPKQPVTTLPKGGKKTFLVSGAKDFNFTEGHEKQLVRNFRNFEKKYGSAQIAHDYNPSNKTSAFVARVAKKYNLPTMEDRPISHKDYNPDPNKKEGFKNRAIAIQKGVDEGKIFRVSYSQKGKLSAVAPDRLERDNWRTRLGEIKKERGWRSLKFNKKSKNTQAYKPINALMDEISDHPVGSAKREAGLGYLREYNEDLKTRLNRPSADVTDFLYRQEEGSLPKGAKLRFEVDDIQSEPKPKTKVLVQKPKPPWSRAYFAKTPGLGKPKIVKVADTPSWDIKSPAERVRGHRGALKPKKKVLRPLPLLIKDSTERRYIEKFEDAYDQGTTSDEVSAKQKKKLKPASKTILTGTKQENIKLATKKTGPDAYGSSSLTQFGQGLEEPKNVSEHLEIEGESKDDTSWTKDKERKQNKGWDRHQKNWAEQQEIEIKKDIENIDKQKPVFKSIERQNKKLKKQGKPLITGKSLLTSQRDPFKWDRQSKTLEHTSDVDMPKETKAEKTAKIQAKVKEGAFGGRAKHGQLKYRPPVRGASAPLKALIPFILGGGALQMLPNEAFGERAAQNMERANLRGGGGKKPFHLRKRQIPLTKLSAKKYRKYA